MKKTKTISLAIVIIITWISVSLLESQTPVTIPIQNDSRSTRIFEAITPCDNSNPPVPYISDDKPCEMMIWHLVLNHDPVTNEPTTYTLQSAYGMSQANTTGIVNGGTTLDLSGIWEIIDSTSTVPDTIIYQLNPDTPEFSIYLTKITDDLLHISTAEHELLVGNGGWSYTLNRTDIKSPLNRSLPAGELSIEPLPMTTSSDQSGIFGIFEGRTPCTDIIDQFMQASPQPSCTKLKWQLTLNQNPKTGLPTTFKVRGVIVRTEATIAELEGKWDIVLAPGTHPNKVLYRLYLDTEYPLFFLKADNNHLYMVDWNLNFMVGNALFSYTLSRTL